MGDTRFSGNDEAGRFEGDKEDRQDDGERLSLGEGQRRGDMSRPGDCGKAGDICRPGDRLRMGDEHFPAAGSRCGRVTIDLVVLGEEASP